MSTSILLLYLVAVGTVVVVIISPLQQKHNCDQCKMLVFRQFCSLFTWGAFNRVCRSLHHTHTHTRAHTHTHARTHTHAHTRVSSPPLSIKATFLSLCLQLRGSSAPEAAVLGRHLVVKHHHVLYPCGHEANLNSLSSTEASWYVYCNWWEWYRYTHTHIYVYRGWAEIYSLRIVWFLQDYSWFKPGQISHNNKLEHVRYTFVSCLIKKAPGKTMF